MVDPAPGLIPGYEMVRLIGEGGMGVVYEAFRISDGRRVALKVMSPGMVGSEAFEKRFKRETEIAASLDHPNVVAVVDAGTEAKTPYLAMEFIEGTDLERRLRAGPLDPQHALRIVEEVGSALDAAHAQGLVHRDVKPANILLDRDDQAYLADFGLTRPATGTRMTSTGVRMGTVDYMAPEQIEDRDVDARTDVYALAAVAFHALAGEVPFPRDSDMATLYAHVHETRPKLPQALPVQVRHTSPVIERGMAREPSDRHLSAGDFAGALQAAFAGKTVEWAERSVATGEAAPGPTRPIGAVSNTVALHQPAQERRSRARRVVSIGIAAALAGALAVAAVLVLPSGSNNAPEPTAEAEALESRRDEPSTPPKPEGIAVPRVTGMTVGDARDRLQARGFVVRVRQQYDRAEAGTVLAQKPSAGRRLGRSEPVAVAVSRGPEPLGPSSLLTTSALGPIEMGMTTLEAERVAGTSFMSLGNDGEGCYYLEPMVKLPGVSFMVNRDEIVRSDISKPGIKTLSGLQVGDTEQEVLAAYGDQIEISQHEYVVDGHYMTFVPDDPSDQTRMVFETNENQVVTGIRAGLLPAALYVEGCS